MSKPSEPFGGFTTTTELPPDERDVGSTLRRLRNIFSSQSAALFLVLIALAVFFSVLRPDAFPRVANVMNMAKESLKAQPTSINEIVYLTSRSSHLC